MRKVASGETSAAGGKRARRGFMPFLLTAAVWCVPSSDFALRCRWFFNKLQKQKQKTKAFPLPWYLLLDVWS